jgi:hypothetical protein
MAMARFMGCDPSFSLVAERAVRVQAALSENEMAGKTGHDASNNVTAA